MGYLIAVYSVLIRIVSQIIVQWWLMLMACGCMVDHINIIWCGDCIGV